MPAVPTLHPHPCLGMLLEVGEGVLLVAQDPRLVPHLPLPVLLRLLSLLSRAPLGAPGAALSHWTESLSPSPYYQSTLPTGPGRPYPGAASSSLPEGVWGLEWGDQLQNPQPTPSREAGTPPHPASPKKAKPR